MQNNLELCTIMPLDKSTAECFCNSDKSAIHCNTERRAHLLDHASFSSKQSIHFDYAILGVIGNHIVQCFLSLEMRWFLTWFCGVLRFLQPCSISLDQRIKNARVHHKESNHMTQASLSWTRDQWCGM